jgi:hypothetical protein
MRVLKGQTKPAGLRNNLDHSFPKMEPVGSIHLDWVTCGKPTCRCARGLSHGPYAVLRWREGGRQRKRYIRWRDLPRVLAEMERQRSLKAKPSEMKRVLKELCHAQ